MTETLEKCAGCDEPLNEDYQSYSQLVDKTFCCDCENSDLEYASQLILIHGDRSSVRFGDNFAYDDDLEIPDWFSELFDEWKGRNYEKTDGWRGYYDSLKQFKGIKEIASGWTTGMPDETTQRKPHFNRFCDDLAESMYQNQYPIYFLAEPTSNLFSISISVFTKEEHYENVVNWLEEIGYPVGLMKEHLS